MKQCVVNYRIVQRVALASIPDPSGGVKIGRLVREIQTVWVDEN